MLVALPDRLAVLGRVDHVAEAALGHADHPSGTFLRIDSAALKRSSDSPGSRDPPEVAPSS